eukprot:3437702-Pyramimonas_sp.AAC.1
MEYLGGQAATNEGITGQKRVRVSEAVQLLGWMQGDAEKYVCYLRHDNAVRAAACKDQTY